MCQRQRLYVIGLAFSASVAIGTISHAQDVANDESVEAIVRRWAQASNDLATVDLQFTRTNHNPAAVENIKWEGRLVLKRPDLALCELRWQEKNAPRTTITVWNRTEVRSLIDSTRTVYARSRDPANPPNVLARAFFPVPFEPAGKLPEVPSVPFLTSTSEKDLRDKYDIHLEHNRKDGPVLRLTPRPSKKSEFDHALVKLDPETYRPTALRLLNGKSTETFVYRDARFNEPIEDAVFQLAVPEGWKLIKYTR